MRSTIPVLNAQNANDDDSLLQVILPGVLIYLLRSKTVKTFWQP